MLHREACQGCHPLTPPPPLHTAAYFLPRLPSTYSNPQSDYKHTKWRMQDNKGSTSASPVGRERREGRQAAPTDTAMVDVSQGCQDQKLEETSDGFVKSRCLRVLPSATGGPKAHVPFSPRHPTSPHEECSTVQVKLTAGAIDSTTTPPKFMTTTVALSMMTNPPTAARSADHCASPARTPPPLGAPFNCVPGCLPGGQVTLSAERALRRGSAGANPRLQWLTQSSSVLGEHQPSKFKRCHAPSTIPTRRTRRAAASCLARCIK